jgi:hypothetical protein
MAGMTGNYSKFEVRAVVRFLQAEGVSRGEIHRRLESVSGQNVPAERKRLCGAKKLKMPEQH